MGKSSLATEKTTAIAVRTELKKLKNLQKLHPFFTKKIKELGKIVDEEQEKTESENNKIRAAVQRKITENGEPSLEELISANQKVRLSDRALKSQKQRLFWQRRERKMPYLLRDLENEIEKIVEVSDEKTLSLFLEIIQITTKFLAGEAEPTAFYKLAYRAPGREGRPNYNKIALLCLLICLAIALSSLILILTGAGVIPSLAIVSVGAKALTIFCASLFGATLSAASGITSFAMMVEANTRRGVSAALIALAEIDLENGSRDFEYIASNSKLAQF